MYFLENEPHIGLLKDNVFWPKTWSFSMFFSKEAPQPFVASLDRFMVTVYNSFISPWLCSCIR